MHISFLFRNLTPIADSVTAARRGAIKREDGYIEMKFSKMFHKERPYVGEFFIYELIAEKHETFQNV